ncbi:MAG: hypothetical protein WB713_04100, partial [Methyloceanibacter sp.]
EREAETAAAFVAAILNVFALSFATPPHLQVTSTRLGELAGRNRTFCMARACAQAQGGLKGAKDSRAINYGE